MNGNCCATWWSWRAFFRFVRCVKALGMKPARGSHSRRSFPVARTPTSRTASARSAWRSITDGLTPGRLPGQGTLPDACQQRLELRKLLRTQFGSPFALDVTQDVADFRVRGVSALREMHHAGPSILVCR